MMPAISRYIAVSLAAVMILSGLSQLSFAEVVAPGDVKIVDDNVAKSLTGSPGDAAKGKKTFASRKLGNCLACHTNKDLSGQPFHGEIGPTLNGVADRYSETELRAILVNSKVVLGSQTIMPSFYRVINDQRTRKEFKDKTILTAEQVEDVLAYLKTLKE